MQMPRRRWIVSALSAAVLTACGGGGGSGGSVRVDIAAIAAL